MADQSVDRPASQKYQQWQTYSDVRNYKTFPPITTNKYYTASFNNVYSDTIQCEMMTGGSPGGWFYFSDPWRVDSSGEYGPMNRMDPIFYSHNSPYTLDLISPDSGVFLNVGGTPPNMSPPYYCVGAPLIETINGYTAFFSGWATSNAQVQDGGPTAGGYDSAAVVFTSGNGSVTALCRYYAVTYNTAVPSGTWPMAGSVTIPSGVTLTGSSGATMNFPSSTTLTVNGTLNGNGMILAASSGSWNGITINTSGVSVTNCTIQDAYQAIGITNASTCTITGCTISNSSFSSSQGIEINNSSPTITNLTINGQSNSASGVRYVNSSGGTLSNSTIQYLGAGHGIIVQANSNPTITGNTIEHNHYTGIICTGDGNGVPSLESDTTSYNGLDGLEFQGSFAYLLNDVASYNTDGIYSENSSQIWTGSQSVAGGNMITNNTNGIIANSNCVIDFGQYTGRWYVGTCNQIYGNSSYNAVSEGSTGSTVTAKYNYWGPYPADASKFYIQSGSTLDYSDALSSPENCPLTGGFVAQKVNPDGAVTSVSSLPSGSDSTSLFQFAEEATAEEEYPLAISAYRTLLSDSISTELKVRALARLFNMFQVTRDTTIIADLQSASQSPTALGEEGELLLGYAFESTHKISKAEATLNDVVSKYPGTEWEKQALILLASMRFFDPAADQISSSALSQLVTEYGSTMDKGELVALGWSSAGSQSAAKSSVTSDSDSASITVPSLGNYPNPFNPTTVIQYQLSRDTHVTLIIYDILGREVATLVDGYQSAGHHEVEFDGSRFSSGVYFYRLTTPAYSKVQKMILMK